MHVEQMIQDIEDSGAAKTAANLRETRQMLIDMDRDLGGFERAVERIHDKMLEAGQS